MNDIVNPTASRRIRSSRSVAALTLATLITALTCASAASVAAIGGSEPPPTSDPPVETTVPETVHSTTAAPVDTPAPAVASPPIEPSSTLAPPPVVADVATVEVLEEIPVVAAVEDDFGASDTDVRVFPDGPTYGGRISFSATVNDDSASCGPFGGCDTPNGTVEFYVDGQFVGSGVLVPDTGGIGDPHRSFASVVVNPDAGAHVVEARYIPGDFDSSSGSASFTVAKADCSATITQLADRSSVGDNPIFVANITGPSSDGPPSGGTITIRDQNGTVVREVTKPSFADTFIGINTLPAGAHTLTFTYSGDENHNACATSNSVTHTAYERVDAVDDSYTIPPSESSHFEYHRFTVLDNDVVGDDAIITTVSVAQHGNVAYGPHHVAFDPEGMFSGTDTFTYTVTNGAGQSDTATVTVTVLDPIVAVDDTTTTSQDDPVTVAVLANDTAPDPMSYIVIAGEPEHGAVVVNDDDSVTYTPTAGYTGTDSFDYQVFDNVRPAATATVTITVEPDPPPTSSSTSTTSTPSTSVPAPTPSSTTVPPAGNSAPVVVADAFRVTTGQPLVVGAPGVLANDVDPDGQPLTAAVGVAPANGTLVLNPDGSFTYTPDAGFVGGDSFTYTASDGQTPTAFGFAAAGRSRSLAPALVSEPVVVSITVGPAAPPVPAGTLPATR